MKTLNLPVPDESASVSITVHFESDDKAKLVFTAYVEQLKASGHGVEIEWDHAKTRAMARFGVTGLFDPPEHVVDVFGPTLVDKPELPDSPLDLLAEQAAEIEADAAQQTMDDDEEED